MGGGKAPAPPPPVDYQAQADAQIRILQQQALLDQQASERAAAERAAQREQELTDFNANLDAGYNSGLARASTELGRLGLDPTEYMPRFEEEFNFLRSTVPQLDPNPGTYFGSGAIRACTSADHKRIQPRQPE